MAKKPRGSRRLVPIPIWVALIGLLGTLGTAVVTKLHGVWPFGKSSRPIYEALMEVHPNPIIRGASTSLQFYFNNSSENRIRLKYMIASGPCDSPRGEQTRVTPEFPGWRSSVVEPQTHKHNFYSAEHSSFSYTCGGSDQTELLSYKFELYFDEGENSQTQKVTFGRNVFVVPPRR